MLYESCAISFTVCVHIMKISELFISSAMGAATNHWLFRLQQLLVALFVLHQCCVVQCVPQQTAAESAAADLNIKTLPPSKVSRTSFMTKEDILANSDALLAEWEGEHWASLDPEEDKVAISWTNTEKDITIQV